MQNINKSPCPFHVDALVGFVLDACGVAGGKHTVVVWWFLALMALVMLLTACFVPLLLIAHASGKVSVGRASGRLWAIRT